MNEDIRPSRLLRSVPSYIRQSVITLIRIYVVYRPFHFFGSIGIVLILSWWIARVAILVLLPYWEWFWPYSVTNPDVCIVGDGISNCVDCFYRRSFSANRKILEEIQYSQSTAASHSEKKKSE